MIQRHYTVTFLTPAFLGDARQNGRWRTPPFKHLLRAWWRVAWAVDHDFDVDVAEMRREEGLLFGHAWLENDTVERNGRKVKVAARKSLVRLRLDRWDEGKMNQWGGDPPVFHPEVGGRGKKIGAHLYLGYGPLNFNNGTFLGRKDGKGFVAKRAIASGEDRERLLLACPEAYADMIERALWLMDRYGTLGGRSRNGWGSLALKPVDGTPALKGDVPLRNWRDCLDRDWPHALGKDEKGALIWRTQSHDNWRSLMKQLAELKIGLRTQFKFHSGKNVPHPEPRHWLSYPVTNHSVRDWGNARLPNSLRFKARQTADGKLFGILYHTPCLPPPAFRPDRRAIEDVWQRVHDYLDQRLAREEA